jgi:hypothetical protein
VACWIKKNITTNSNHANRAQIFVRNSKRLLGRPSLITLFCMWS